MATASILSRVIAPVPKGDITNASRDDLAVSDVVELESVNVGTAYQWTIAFKPEGSIAVFSSSGTVNSNVQNPGTFTVDREGPYLIRLQFTDGTGTTEQYVRLRALTATGSLKLIAAGERYDAVSIPVDTTPSGWADEQNYNLNQLLSLVGGGADEQVKVTGADTTPGFLSDKLITATTGVAFTTLNPGADEDYRLDIDTASTTGQGLIEIATQAEVDAGASTTLAVTPATLASATTVATSLQTAYDLGPTITTAGATDIAFTLSAAGGGFTVDGDGAVAFGGTTEVTSLSAFSAGGMTLQSRDTSLVWMQANDGADKTLTVKGTNSGAGAGHIQIEAGDEIQLVPGSALAPGSYKKVTLPDSAGTFYGTPQFGVVYVPGFNSLLIGGSGNAAPGSPLSVAPGTTPNNIFMITVGVDTNAAGAGSATGAIEISSGEAVSTANDAGNSGSVSLKSGNSQGTTGGGNSGVVLVRSGESSYGNSGGIQLVTGQVQATSTGETGSIELTTGVKNGAGSNSGLIRLTTGNAPTTTSGNVEIVTGTGGAARGRLEIDSGHTRIKEGVAPSAGVATFGQVHVDDGSGSLVAGSLYYTDPSGAQTRLNAPSLDRHHINIPEAPNNTVEYKGWASYACVLKKVKILCVTANTQGTLILTITNNATGNTVLSTANLNINSTAAATAGVLTNDTIYSAFLTGAAADLAFAEDDRWTISVASNNPLMDADSIYVDLTFEVT